MESAVCIEKKRCQEDRMHALAPSVQVRVEDTGLLFYCSKGPRLYFLNSGTLVEPHYFGSNTSLRQWLEEKGIFRPDILGKLAAAMEDLVQKGVLTC